MPAVGSSRNTSSGRPTTAHASASTLLLSAGQPPVGRARRLGQAERVHQPLRDRAGWRHTPQRDSASRRPAPPDMPPPPCSITPMRSRTLGVVGDGSSPRISMLPRVGLDEAFAHLHRGGLARAVGAEQREHFGGLHVEVEFGDRGRRPVPLADPAQAHGDSVGGSRREVTGIQRRRRAAVQRWPAVAPVDDWARLRLRVAGVGQLAPRQPVVGQADQRSARSSVLAAIAQHDLEQREPVAVGRRPEDADDEGDDDGRGAERRPGGPRRQRDDRPQHVPRLAPPGRAAR